MNRKERHALLFLPACVFLFLSLAVCSAQAADAVATNSGPDLSNMSLDALMNVDVPVVYSASKFEQKATEAPSEVTVITSDDIKRYGYRTLADILRSVPGFDVTYDRDHAYLGVGGVNLGDFNSRILLMVNGHRVNNNLTDGAYIDTAFILDVDLIDRVEIVRGPGSVLYGNNAFFGVINVITREGKQLNGAEVSGEYGEFDTYKARASYGRQFDSGLEFLLSGTYYDSAGEDHLFYPEFDTPAQDHGVARDMDGDSYGSAFASVGYKDLTLEGAFIHRDKDNPTAQFLDTTFDDPRLRTVDDRGYVKLKYDHKFSDTLDLSADVYYDQSETLTGLPIGAPGGAPPAPVFFEEQQTGEWAGGEVQLNKRMWNRNMLTVGGEFRDDFKQDDRTFEVEPTSGASFDLQDHRHNFGVFAQDDFTVVTNLHLNAGVRYDQAYDARANFSPSWSPRAAVIYNPSSQSTLKFIYGTAFRDPSFNEISEAVSSPSVSAPEPEKITSYELDYEQGFGSHWRGSISGFYNKLDQLIVFDSGVFTNFNVDAGGMELAVEGHWTNCLDGRLSYTLQGTRDRTSNLELPDSPDNLVKLNLNVPIIHEKVWAGLEVQYTSQRRSWQYLTTVNPPTPVQGSDVGGFAVVNLTLFSQNLVKNLDVFASVYNLFDTRYSDPASQFHVQEAIPQDGRAFRVKLTYRF